MAWRLLFTFYDRLGFGISLFRDASVSSSVLVSCWLLAAIGVGRVSPVCLRTLMYRDVLMRTLTD